MTDWRVHLGVHKTATTHLQNVLEASKDMLASKGVGYVPVETLRPLTGNIFRPPGIKRRLIGAPPGTLDATLLPFADGYHTMVLSEENWIGDAWEACLPPPYPMTEKRLEHLRDLTDPARLSLFLAIRNPADFATSVVAEAMRHDPGKVSIDRARTAWLGEENTWADMVARIKRAFPEASLTVWPYEGYRENARRIAEAVTGVAFNSFPELPDPVSTKRPSAAQVEKMSRKRWPLSWVSGATSDRRDSRETTDKFVLFSEEERKEMSARYEIDKALIRDRYPGVMLDLAA